MSVTSLIVATRPNKIKVFLGKPAKNYLKMKLYQVKTLTGQKYVISQKKKKELDLE